MSKERLMKIFNDYREVYNWLCYEYVEDFGGFFLYKNSHKVAEFFLDDYDLVMTGGINTSTQIEKAIRVLIANYIVQEEENLRSKKFYLRMKNNSIGAITNYLNYHTTPGHMEIGSNTETSTYKSQFTEIDIEYFKSEIDGFSELLELFKREYVEGLE